MIYVARNSTVQGNIVLNGSNNSMPAIYFINDTERTQSNVSYNDCYNNVGDCGNTDGNINAEPDFVDTIDYELSAGSSPAIDTGPANEHLTTWTAAATTWAYTAAPTPWPSTRRSLPCIQGCSDPFRRTG